MREDQVRFFPQWNRFSQWIGKISCIIEEKLPERRNFRLILNDLDRYNEILNKFTLKLKLESIRVQWDGWGRFESKDGDIVFFSDRSFSYIRCFDARSSGRRRKVALAARARFSIVSTVFPQAVNALLGGFRPLLCVHRDPVPPRDISPPFSAFTSTLTSFSTTFSGTFYPPLLFTRTPPSPTPYMQSLPPLLHLLLGGENRDTLVRLEAIIYF